jgi:hypothetical protein
MTINVSIKAAKSDICSCFQTYALMNHRDSRTGHHIDMYASIEAIDAYIHAGVPSWRANLGLAYYVK